MKIYTIQLASWREAKRLGIPLKDITTKSGDEIFSPERYDVVEHNLKNLSDVDYARKYKEKLLRSYNMYRPEWERFLEKEAVALACYRSADSNPDRYILKDFILWLCVKLNIPCSYCGEITKDTDIGSETARAEPHVQAEFSFMPSV